MCYNKCVRNNRRQAVIAPNFVRGAQILYNMRNLRITFIDVKLILSYRAKQSARKTSTSLFFTLCQLKTGFIKLY